MTLIVVPWRDVDGTRTRACQLTCTALRHLLPGTPLLLCDSGHEPFNRAASRNLGVNHAADHEVVLVSDADVIHDSFWSGNTQSLAAIVEAARDGKVHYPFTVCHYLDADATDDTLGGKVPDPTRLEFSISSAQGGMMMMIAATWRAIGGMDERFIGWGYEDNDWYARATRTVGWPRHHPGILWHLWHPGDRYRWTLDETRNLVMARAQQQRPVN